MANECLLARISIGFATCETPSKSGFHPFDAGDQSASLRWILRSICRSWAANHSLSSLVRLIRFRVLLQCAFPSSPVSQVPPCHPAQSSLMGAAGLDRAIVTWAANFAEQAGNRVGIVPASSFR